MKDILSEIIAHKRIEIELQKQAVSLERLQEEVAAMMQKDATTGTSVTIPCPQHETGACFFHPRESLPNSNAVLLRKDGYTRLPVPKKYPLHTKQPVLPQSLSLRTKKFFGGSLQDIRMARPLVGIPILRKDFIIDEYQLLQARIVGADAVLLIAACLTQEECATLTARAHALGLEVLLEIHTFLRTRLCKRGCGYGRRQQP